MNLLKDFSPKTFDDLVGQPTAVKLFKKWSKDLEELPKTLALLGKSGVGKTSSIKILAALLTCNSLVEKEGYREPCGECPACKNAFERQWNPIRNVHFYSGKAENADLIEEIRSYLPYAPQGTPYRVVILDEIQDATPIFKNALLALLEEEHPTTKFIISSMDEDALLLTGKNIKNPKALMNRCRILKFIRVKDVDITNHLYKILDKIDPNETFPETLCTEVMPRIIHSAEGSIREAIESLETCIDAEAFTDNLADQVLLNVSERAVDDVLKSLLNKSPDVFSKLSELDNLGELFRLANAKIINGLVKYVEGTLDAGDFYSEKCKEVFNHPNYNTLRSAFSKVHLAMGSYWRDDIFKTILCDYILDPTNTPVVEKVSLEEKPIVSRRR